jgi:hypothetical protein
MQLFQGNFKEIMERLVEAVLTKDNILKQTNIRGIDMIIRIRMRC